MSVRVIDSDPTRLVIDATDVQFSPIIDCTGCLVPRAVRWPTEIRWALCLGATGVHDPDRRRRRWRRRRPWRVTFRFHYPDPSLYRYYRRAVLPLEALA